LLADQPFDAFRVYVAKTHIAIGLDLGVGVWAERQLARDLDLRRAIAAPPSRRRQT
jgi:hypothetical protein